MTFYTLIACQKYMWVETSILEADNGFLRQEKKTVKHQISPRNQKELCTIVNSLSLIE